MAGRDYVFGITTLFLFYSSSAAALEEMGMRYFITKSQPEIVLNPGNASSRALLEEISFYGILATQDGLDHPRNTRLLFWGALFMCNFENCQKCRKVE